MSTTFQTNIAETEYNGWTNYETWNVALWIQNDQSLYDVARRCDSYDEVKEMLWECGSKETPDGVKWDSAKINDFQINEMLQDL